MISSLRHLSNVLERPGQVAATCFARRQLMPPVLFLLALVALATLGLMGLQANHPAWSIIRQTSPLIPAQMAQLAGKTGYWGVYHNARQLLLIPLFALPTWLVYRRQGIRYANAVLMHVLWNTAHALYSLLIFGMVAAHILPITTRGNGLAFLLMIVCLTAIGRTALDLQWIMAVAKALATGLLVGLILRLLASLGL
jgi:hypothetical protein